MSTDGLLVFALLYGVVPAWLALGLADWLCHHRARIELNASWPESLMHLVQLALVGAPLLAALFLQVNALVILVMLAGLVLHQAVAVIDVRYADRKRHVAPTEQHVHGGLEMVPVFATFLVVVLHWPQARSLWEGTAVFRFELKHQPLPVWYLALVLAGVVLFAVVPYVEELVRAIRLRPRSVTEPEATPFRLRSFAGSGGGFRHGPRAHQTRTGNP